MAQFQTAVPQLTDLQIGINGRGAQLEIIIGIVTAPAQIEFAFAPLIQQTDAGVKPVAETVVEVEAGSRIAIGITVTVRAGGFISAVNAIGLVIAEAQVETRISIAT